MSDLIKNQECATCKRMFDCDGKLKGTTNCIGYESDEHIITKSRFERLCEAIQKDKESNYEGVEPYDTRRRICD